MKVIDAQLLGKHPYIHILEWIRTEEYIMVHLWGVYKATNEASFMLALAWPSVTMQSIVTIFRLRFCGRRWKFKQVPVVAGSLKWIMLVNSSAEKQIVSRARRLNLIWDSLQRDKSHHVELEQARRVEGSTIASRSPSWLMCIILARVPGVKDMNIGGRYAHR